MLRQLSLILSITLFSVCSVFAGQMARVVFVTGDVLLEHKQHKQQPVVGDIVQEGDLLTTKDGAHLHLATVDNGFISLRPASQLQISSYQYDANHPENTQIKLDLHYGVMRAVSGTGAQAAKQNYRLNTPLAAIGIRGTDYSVIANTDFTRATVITGGIVMSNYSEGCAQSGAGVCAGQGSKDLFANQGNAMLAIERDQPLAQRIDNPPASSKPDAIAPPRPEEQKNLNQPNNAMTHNLIPVIDPTRLSDLEARLKPIPTLENKTVDTATNTNNTVANTVEQVGRQLYWGKWQQVANMPAEVVIQNLNQMNLVALNPLFVIAQDKGSFTLPAQGHADFALTGSQAYLVSPDTSKTPILASVNDANLSIDFAQKTFDTKLNVAGENLTIPFYAQGSITPDGVMNASYQNTNGAINGSLAGANASNAAYLFQTRPDIASKGYTAVGATAWQATR